MAPSFAQRQADAMGMIAECALVGGLDRGTAGDRYQVVVHVDAGAQVADSGERRRSEMVRRPNERTAGAAARGGRGAAQEDVPAGTSAASYTPGCPGRVAQMPAGSVFGEGDVRRMRQMSARGSDAVSASSVECVHSAPSQTVLDEAGGIHVSPETARRLACDAATVAMRHGPDGEVLDVGRKTRTISPALRRAWRPATGSAGSQAASIAAATATTCGTGPTVVLRRSTICCCCAGYHKNHVSHS